MLFSQAKPTVTNGANLNIAGVDVGNSIVNYRGIATYFAFQVAPLSANVTYVGRISAFKCAVNPYKLLINFQLGNQKGTLTIRIISPEGNIDAQLVTNLQNLDSDFENSALLVLPDMPISDNHLVEIINTEPAENVYITFEPTIIQSVEPLIGLS